MRTQDVKNAITDQGSRVASASSPQIERLARVGFASKSLLYMVVGVLAVRAAAGMGGKMTGTKGALREIVAHPFGKVLLIVMAIGLLGYAAWRVIEGFADPERKGTDAKGLALRGSYVVRGILHALLAVQAFRIASANNGGGGGGAKDGAAAQQASSQAMQLPFGNWLVILGGIGVACFGLYQVYRAWESKLDKQLDFPRLRREAGDWAVPVSRFGIAARGVVFVMIGTLLVAAGRHHNASQAGGIGEAFASLEQAPYGRTVLLVVALGMVAYGVYVGIQARYRHITAR
ncbi:MAG: DUF1206 domain-containing protein [Gemmatimonadota bacterium]|nr:DUF1206 domain-containing protein [Gemmatimonadota bacterium]